MLPVGPSCDTDECIGCAFATSHFAYIVEDVVSKPRTKEEINLEALPTKEGMQVGVLLFRPDEQRVLGLKDAAGARKLFEVRSETAALNSGVISLDNVPVSLSPSQLSRCGVCSTWEFFFLVTFPYLSAVHTLFFHRRSYSLNLRLWSRTRRMNGWRCRQSRDFLHFRTRGRCYISERARCYWVSCVFFVGFVSSTKTWHFIQMPPCRLFLGTDFACELLNSSSFIPNST